VTCTSFTMLPGDKIATHRLLQLPQVFGVCWQFQLAAEYHLPQHVLMLSCTKNCQPVNLHPHKVAMSKQYQCDLQRKLHNTLKVSKLMLCFPPNLYTFISTQNFLILTMLCNMKRIWRWPYRRNQIVQIWPKSWNLSGAYKFERHSWTKTNTRMHPCMDLCIIKNTAFIMKGSK
jgi:hypothetical protein